MDVDLVGCGLATGSPNRSAPADNGVSGVSGCKVGAAELEAAGLGVAGFVAAAVGAADFFGVVVVEVGVAGFGAVAGFVAAGFAAGLGGLISGICTTSLQ